MFLSNICPTLNQHWDLVLVCLFNQGCEIPVCHDWSPAIFSDSVVSVSRSCHFALYNIEKISCIWSSMSMLISLLNNCSALLAGLRASTVNPYMYSKLRQCIWCSISLKGHVTPILIEFHGLNMASHLKFKLVLARRVSLVCIQLMYLNPNM